MAGVSDRGLCALAAAALLPHALAQDAWAYIDPGSGSIVFQALIGALVGAGMAVKIYWYKIRSYLTRSRQ